MSGKPHPRSVVRRRVSLAWAMIGALVLLAPATASATVSGENGRIAFVRDSDIWTVNRAGTKQIQVTKGSIRDGDPAWSPDGKWIVFTRYETKGPAIYRVKSDGSALDRIDAGAE